MTQHMSERKLRFSEEQMGAEHLSLSKTELQFCPCLFWVWLLMLSKMSSLLLCSGDSLLERSDLQKSLLTLVRFCFRLFLHLESFDPSCLSCTIIIDQCQQPENRLYKLLSAVTFLVCLRYRRMRSFSFTELSKMLYVRASCGAKWQSCASHLTSLMWEDIIRLHPHCIPGASLLLLSDVKHWHALWFV